MCIRDRHNVKYFAANSNYYLNKNGFDAHDILLCVKDGEKKATPVGRGRGFRYGMQNKESVSYTHLDVYKRQV